MENLNDLFISYKVIGDWNNPFLNDKNSNNYSYYKKFKSGGTIKNSHIEYFKKGGSISKFQTGGLILNESDIDSLGSSLSNLFTSFEMVKSPSVKVNVYDPFSVLKEVLNYGNLELSKKNILERLKALSKNNESTKKQSNNLKPILITVAPLAATTSTLTASQYTAPQMTLLTQSQNIQNTQDTQNESLSLLQTNTTSNKTLSKVIDFAKQLIGGKYVLGGTGKTGYDCSSLIRIAYEKLGIKVPPVPHLWLETKEHDTVNKKEGKPGDVIVTASGPGYHVMMITDDLGDGKYKIVQAANKKIGIVSGIYDTNKETNLRRVVRVRNINQ